MGTEGWEYRNMGTWGQGYGDTSMGTQGHGDMRTWQKQPGGVGGLA